MECLRPKEKETNADMNTVAQDIKESVKQSVESVKQSVMGSVKDSVKALVPKPLCVGDISAAIMPKIEAAIKENTPPVATQLSVRALADEILPDFRQIVSDLVPRMPTSVPDTPPSSRKRARVHHDLDEIEEDTLGDLVCTPLQVPARYPIIEVLTNFLHTFKRYRAGDEDGSDQCAFFDALSDIIPLRDQFAQQGESPNSCETLEKLTLLQPGLSSNKIMEVAHRYSQMEFQWQQALVAQAYIKLAREICKADREDSEEG
jgi:hypothetical protein